MKRKLMIILVMACMWMGTVVCQTGDVAVQAAESGEFEYSQHSNFVDGEWVYTITISGYSGSETKLEIPQEIDGKTVTAISSGAFQDCSKLTSVTIPEGVTEIGSSAFYECSSLTSVTIPEGVTEIGSSAFSGCSSLTSVTIPEGVTEIGDSAFSGCSSLTSVTIPEGVTEIGSSAFYECSSLTSVTIPEGVTKICYWTFSGCSKLTSVTIPEGVTEIGDSAFSGCSNLETVTYTGSEEQWYQISFQRNSFLGYEDIKKLAELAGMTYAHAVNDDGTITIIDYNGNEDKLIIPSTLGGRSVTEIGSSAFSGCSKLTSVTIPEGVTTIGREAFSGCSKLTSVTIPEGVTEIGDSAFSGCSSLTSVTIPEGVTEIGSSAFYECSSLTSVTIPEGVTKICYWTFSGCSKLTSVTIPEGVTEIESSAFSGCSNLETVTYTGSEEQWYQISFVGYEDIKKLAKLAGMTYAHAVNDDGTITIIDYNGNEDKLIIPSTLGGRSVTEIGSNAFYECSKLTSVTIPEGVTEIGGGAFYGCSNLETVTYTGSEEQWYQISFVDYDYEDIKKLAELAGMTYAHAVNDDGTITIIDYNGNEDKLIIPSTLGGRSVTRLGGAFSECSNLKSIMISASVTEIGGPYYDEDADCYYNYNRDIEPARVFSDCDSLAEILVDSNNPSYTSIDGVLYNKEKTEILACPEAIVGTIIIPEGVTKIGYDIFSGCSGLKSIKIPATVTALGEDDDEEINYFSLFNDCDSLAEILVDSNNPSYASIDGVLYNKEKTELLVCPKAIVGAIIIPEGVATIDGDAFRDCSSLTSVVIPEGVTRIDYNTFSGCSNLASVTIPKGVTEIGYSAFSGCSNLTSVTIPEGVTTIEYYAFGDCSSLTSVVIPESVTEIGGHAFENCSSLISITIPKGVTKINAGILMDCSNLISVTISEGVTEIEGYYYWSSGTWQTEAFSGCSNLASITIPVSMLTIGEKVFQSCTKLKDVYYAGTQEQWNKMEILGYNAPLRQATIHFGKSSDVNTNEGTSTNNTKKPSATPSDKKNNGTNTPYSSVTEIKNVELSETNVTYNGKLQKPDVTVKDVNGKIVNDANYTIVYVNNKKVGLATVTVTGKDNYTGTLTATFKILPKGTALSKVTAQKEAFVAKWKKQTKEVTGYQLQYSTSKKFKGAKTITINKNKTTSATVKKLKSNKKYYVRIRTYKTVKIDGQSKDLYSEWSKAKTAITES